MTDTRLQALRRRAATGSPEDRAAWLRGRLRAGTLTRERIELAAYCGDEGALIATAPMWRWIPFTGSDRGALPNTWDLVRWLRGLSRWGREVEDKARGLRRVHNWSHGCGFREDCPERRAAVSSELIRWALS